MCYASNLCRFLDPAFRGHTDVSADFMNDRLLNPLLRSPTPCRSSRGNRCHAEGSRPAAGGFLGGTLIRWNMQHCHAATKTL